MNSFEFTASEERQQEIRQTIESRPLFSSSSNDSSKRSGFPKTVVQNTWIKNGASSLKRHELGVCLKSKEPRDSVESLAGPSSSTTPSKLLSLCDYTSSSSEDSQ